jgi:hypothetical protein
MKLPNITKKQQYILKLIYDYRYLDRKQIQLAMDHKDKRRIIAWLKDMREKQYVEWIYSTDFVEKTKPAIYYLGINGIRYLKSLDEYPIEELRKRYKDAGRSRTFIDRSLLVIDCCLALRTANESSSGEGFGFIPEAGYIDPDHDYHFLAEHGILRPNICIIKYDKQEVPTANYLLEIFDSSLPRYRMRYRLKKYVTYLEDGEWQGGDPAPVILLVCPSITDLIYAKRSTKKLIEDTYEDDLHIRFTTIELLRKEGITAKIWEEGRLRYGI